ncbi:MAG: haloacid dehalogenase [Armatimonadetes bacterium]|uniref:Haloacid dehalogenase n=1 Tax=Candidatus Nitrosymbiomonas proteolyticus TaxID=2608984 RepID=A0A809S633_9BACT|nr:haloacid dehalogenase [Armatimonadota bacterium]MCK6632498.1 hypothetical protein [Fimbriimonadaceae bacterium]BBO24486.1 haloacid dehalogenase [Candidatus Nitrosymbiomonas proteolyticus]NOG38180.1 haloacid dehalogenase [Armatimonadota bacterium]NUM38073.1 haloacid dehalogenase [Armatimonadota bacterium]
MSTWEKTAEELRDQAQAMHEAREIGLKASRAAIQFSARSIRHVHRRQYEKAEELLAEAKGAICSAQESLAPFPNIYYAGFLHDGEKEVVEAASVLSIARGSGFPTPSELGVMPMSFLNGMGEAASECRRFALDRMRAGDLVEASRILDAMEAVYEELITFDYSDAMTGGLRRTTDALRAVVERTRSDLTATTSQHELVEELKRTREALGK